VVLNAKHHEKEAKIIIQAGRSGALTVATNMAGRGVDIILGGNPPDKADADKAKEAGGLFVLGTERHESRRIDNQLRGRSGRQGDPGVSQFYISMEDDLMRIFGGERLRNLMERLGLPDDQPIEHSLISKSIESAQRRVEGHNFDIRKHLVEYDDVMNKQREVFYRRRRKILYLDPVKDETLHDEILGKLTQEEVDQYNKQAKSINPVTLRAIEKRVFLSVMDQSWVEHLNTMDELRDSIGLRGYGQVDPLIAYKEESLTLFEGLMRGIDEEAVEILLKIDFSTVQAQVAPQPPEPNPLEYHGADQTAGEEVIEEAAAQEETAVAPVEEKVAVAEEKLPSGAPEKPAPARSSGVITTVRSVSEKMEKAVRAQTVPGQKVGRNDPCPCGSGKKYKKCCGR
jgi:preprotein translocase subunit SecA